MMYSEFVKGTGCKDNAHNYKVFQNLEAMYMNTEMSKAEVYEYGKKLVDNSKSEEELELERKIKAEIEEIKEQIKINKRFAEWAEGIEDKHMVKYYKEENKRLRNRIAALKWVLGE